MVDNSTNINKNHLSPKLIEWWSTIPPISTKITSHLNYIEWWSTISPISTKITSHFNSLSERQQFHQYQQKSPLTSIHWVMVNNSTNINKNHLSLQLIEWRQQFHQYQQKSPLTSIHWVMVNNSTNINKNHLSLQLIEWWSTIPPISTKITSHYQLIEWCQQFHQYQQKSPLTINSLSDVNNSTNINKNHLSHQLIEWCQ